MLMFSGRNGIMRLARQLRELELCQCCKYLLVSLQVCLQHHFLSSYSKFLTRSWDGCDQGGFRDSTEAGEDVLRHAAESMWFE